MMCNEWEAQLNEYVDGTLAAEAQALVEAHLAGCAGCRAAVAELRGLVDGARGLPRTIEPASDLWAGIAGRIGKRGAGIGKRWWRGVLAVAATIVIGFALYRLLPPSAVHHRSEGTGWVAVQAEYERASDELTRALATERDRLAPATVALLERNLAAIDAALRESRDALARDPENVELRGLVASAAREKVELLRWATRVAT